MFIRSNERPPEGLVAVKSVVLAEGEATGHCHTLMGEEVYLWQQDGQRYVRAQRSPGAIAHPDHDPAAVPALLAGQTYRVVRQREWDLAGQWRQVQD